MSEYAFMKRHRIVYLVSSARGAFQHAQQPPWLVNAFSPMIMAFRTVHDKVATLALN